MQWGNNMRDDQILKLMNRSESLTDIFIEEADPDKWPGAGIQIAEYDKETRGDRYWSKKNAAATLTVIMKIENLVDTILNRRDASPDEDADIDKSIKKAEKDAEAILERFQNEAKKAAFLKRTYGKAQ